jgi:hypothetical protein
MPNRICQTFRQKHGWSENGPVQTDGLNIDHTFHHYFSMIYDLYCSRFPVFCLTQSQAMAMAFEAAVGLGQPRLQSHS